MLSKRIIPVFLLEGKRLVKGRQFREHVDVGDPTSQGMIYDAQGADELIVVDIEASSQGRIISTDVINNMIHKCRLPIGAGGGIKSVNDARKCFEAGADKIVINTHAIINPLLVKALADEFGSQSVLVSVDVKESKAGEYEVYIYSGKHRANVSLQSFLEEAIKYGAGEVMVTVIDREGTLSGFACGLYAQLRKIVPVPLIASGGAGCYDHIVELFEEADCDACGIGKMLFLRDYDIVRIKSYLKGKIVSVREA